MENVSEALMMAGGILLAMLTLVLLVALAGNLSTVGEAQFTEEEMQHLTAWNAEWEAYNKQVLYGADVLTVFNKAEQNNEDYDNNALYSVNVRLIDEDGNDVDDIEKYIVDERRKTNIFTCETMNSNNQTGRIQDIVFRYVE